MPKSKIYVARALFYSAYPLVKYTHEDIGNQKAVSITFLSGDADEDPVRFFSFWGCEGWEYSRPGRNSTTLLASPSTSAADSVET